MVYYKTTEEIELMRISALMVSKTLSLVGSLIKPGVTSKEIDKKAETFIRDNGGIPGFLNYGGFPATLCISVNEAVVHGIPTDYEFKEKDIVSVDCGVIMNDFFGDSAYTFAVGDVDDDVMKLLSVTYTSLYLGIEQAVVGKRIGDIGYAIQNFCEREHGYGVVRDLIGHGVGKNLHEAPEVPNFGKRGRGAIMKDGLVIAIEPMVNMGTKVVRQLDDHWTIITKDRKPSAHYEHTVAVKKGKADILSDHGLVDDAVKKNSALKSVPLLEVLI